MRKRNFWVDIYGPDGLPVWGYPVTCYTEIEAEVAAKKAYRETFGKDAVKRIRADAVDNDLSNCTHAGAYDALKQLYHKLWTAYVSASDEAARLRQIMQEHDEAEEYAKAAAAAGQQDLLEPKPDHPHDARCDGFVNTYDPNSNTGSSTSVGGQAHLDYVNKVIRKAR